MSAAPRFGTVVLTGSTSGIGEATAHRLAALADQLVLLGPEPEADVAPVLAGIRDAGAARVAYVTADFARLSAIAPAARAVRALAPRIDLLINDAGVPGAPERVLTVDGFERTLQVNALAPALFTRLLIPATSAGGRIVNVGSSAHRVERFDLADPDLAHGYTPTAAYCRSKLAMVTWSSLLAEEEAHGSLVVVALCPGLNDTALSAAMAGRIGGPPDRGARRVLHAATADVPSGSYLEDDMPTAPSAEVKDPGNRRRLTELFTARLTPFAVSRA